FKIRKGEIFGFLGSNGCGKTTTMRMLTGLLTPTEGCAELFGNPIDAESMDTRLKLGYMTQLFSLYNELTIKQNLMLYARLYRIKDSEVKSRVQEMLERFQLLPYADDTPQSLPLGIKQRLSLAAAVIHRPQILILDEPTSGVDPVARDLFWEMIIELSRQDGVTIFITTHFMNEAERCDRISLMHAGRSLACDTPANLVKERNMPTLEEAFIDYLEAADPASKEKISLEQDSGNLDNAPEVQRRSLWKRFIESNNNRFSIQRVLCCCWRDSLELMRDPIRATLAIFGALLLMLVMGFGISMDVEDLSFAVLDRDGSGLSKNYALNIAGSRYFIEQQPIKDYADLEKRLRSGKLSLAIEIPPNFGKDLQAGKKPQVAFFIDGAMPSRAETVNGYVSSLHNQWLEEQAREHSFSAPAVSSCGVETRYRYNPDVLSLPAMVPAVIPLLLMMIPAILAALAVVREKEMGSIINLYVTPLTRSEFLIGKQMPYVMFSILSALMLIAMAVTIFDVPVKGSVLVLLISIVLYSMCSTGFGLLASSITRSQIAVIFMTMLGTMLPAVQFCGMIDPVTSQEGAGRIIGMIYPTTYMLLISRGVFNKALDIHELYPELLALLITVPIVIACGVMLLKKQEK
ncbi:MAG: ABC transporter ATP-binding protein/permease, partial [Lentisphaeria bacterium]|nr:ABC transporter ATP-binding protein/permease [Lentisphaeria bacterium]